MEFCLLQFLQDSFHGQNPPAMQKAESQNDLSLFLVVLQVPGGLGIGRDRLKSCRPPWRVPAAGDRAVVCIVVYIIASIIASNMASIMTSIMTYVIAYTIFYINHRNHMHHMNHVDQVNLINLMDHINL